LLVLGHGGDRFRDHRPALGAVASGVADEIVITMDNPRSEDPADIAGQIAAGIIGEEVGCHTILDREEAIRFALSISTHGDAVLVAGKGPEKYIIVGDKRFPHDDSEAIRRWIAERGSWE
ncbi:MAG: UDP-N-acetylmuramoyl-L-alanyl-D-glutamate--2,6-diaminopimelate ligase, partial [Synergistota bacterium]|nr:UDP-N-acetylmuramoyl-L-alanyl-D-glutamate--2,6-diaminopimelate ligase [Synergistota bacterium]